jgi:radical SAM PhpK family P-methyltransferase
MYDSCIPECIIVGYNETPFTTYERLLQKFSRTSLAYRDLRLNFITLEGVPTRYIDVLNRAVELSSSERKSPITSDLESGDIPNLASVYLTSFLRRRGISAQFVNLFQREKDKLARYLEQGVRCVAFTTTFYVINFPVYEMAEFVRRINPNVKIVLGGPLILNHLRNYDSAGFELQLEDIGADIYVIDSQGEETLANIVRGRGTGGNFRDVPNIVYFDAGQLHRTAVVAENNSLDENYVDWSRFVDQDLGCTIQTRTARSCAFSCSFCNYPTRAGKLSLASIDTIEKELDSIARLGDVKNLVFIDDTFNVPLPRFKDICRLMIRRRYDFEWFSYFRCSNSDEEAIELMARSGCKGVFLGIESGSNQILKNMNKAATIEKYLEGIKHLDAHQILTLASFIIGFPGETEETVRETS